MKRSVPAKTLAFAYVSAVALTACAVAAFVAQSYAYVPRRMAPQKVEMNDAMLPRLTQAKVDLGAFAAERTGGRRAFRPTSTAQAFALYVPKPVDPAASDSEPLALDSPTLSLVILKTHRGAQIVLDGKPVRLGQTLPGGGRIKAVGRTYIDIEDAEGERRRIDIKDRFTTEAARKAN